MATIKKYPVVIPYVHTKDDGAELKYTIRSLSNVENWNGKVFVVGDREVWFNGINEVKTKRVFGKRYIDQVSKMRTACLLPEMPSKFIAMMDDIIITKPTKVAVYYLGNLRYESFTAHKISKGITRDKLESMGLKNILDYESHAPMLVDKVKLLETLEFILKDKDKARLQWRSMYGNMHQVKAERFEDKKTYTNELLSGPIISTEFYTDELKKLFPQPSLYEITI